MEIRFTTEEDKLVRVEVEKPIEVSQDTIKIVMEASQEGLVEFTGEITMRFLQENVRVKIYPKIVL